MLRKVILLLLLSTISGAPAFAVSVKLEGVGNQTNVRGTADDITYSARTGIGGGAELSLPFSGDMSFDIGALYYQRKYNAEFTSGLFKGYNVTATQDTVQIPVIIRWWLGHVISIGVGGYYAQYMGDIKDSTTVSAGATASTSAQTYDAASQFKSDYGVTVALGLDIPMGMFSGFVIDGRYNYGLKNQSTTGSAKFTDMQGLVGLRFGMNFMK